MNLPQGAEDYLTKPHEADQLTTPRPKVPGVNELENYQTPPREALQQIKPLVSPATMSKNELNDAALTLKWLSEGWNTGECKGQTREKGRRLSNSPQESSKKAKVLTNKSNLEGDTPLVTKIRKDMMSFAEEKTPVNIGNIPQSEPLTKSEEPPIQLKSKRAASYKCAAMLKEALFEETREKAERKDFSVPKVSAQKIGKPKKANSAVNDTARKRSRNYSENSRVGRAVQAIYQYIIKHQPVYLKRGARGVPERVIRVEYGNNPDTSKALRYLVTENRINREGIGGRKDPFSYTVKPVSMQSFVSQSQSPLLVSLGVPPGDLWANPQNDPNDQPTAVAASLAEPSTTNAFSPREDEERSTIKSKNMVQPRLSFGEPIRQNTKIDFDQALKANAAPLSSVSPLLHLDQNNFIRSTMIEKETSQLNLLQEMAAKQTSMPPAMQTAYLMQMHAAHILWNQTLMAMNAASQNTSENQNNPSAPRGGHQC